MYENNDWGPEGGPRKGGPAEKKTYIFWNYLIFDVIFHGFLQFSGHLLVYNDP